MLPGKTHFIFKKHIVHVLKFKQNWQTITSNWTLQVSSGIFLSVGNGMYKVFGQLRVTVIKLQLPDRCDVIQIDTITWVRQSFTIEMLVVIRLVAVKRRKATVIDDRMLIFTGVVQYQRSWPIQTFNYNDKSKCHAACMLARWTPKLSVESP